MRAELYSIQANPSRRKRVFRTRHAAAESKAIRLNRSKCNAIPLRNLAKAGILFFIDPRLKSRGKSAKARSWSAFCLYGIRMAEAIG